MYKILVVDDEAMETDAMHRIITANYGERCITETAYNGKQAIEVAKRLRPDIVIMDIEMPGINGLDAAKLIKEMIPRCRIMIVSAYERFQYAQLAISLGAEEYLLKPVTNADLLRMLDKAMADIDADNQDEARKAALDELAREQFVLSVISGYVDEASLEKQLEELGTPFDYGFFSVVKGETPGSAEMISGCLRRITGGLEGMAVFAYEYDDSLLVATLMGAAYREEAEIRATIMNVVEQVERETRVSLRIGIGHLITSLGEMQRSYGIAMKALATATQEQPVCFPPEEMEQAQHHKGLARKLYGFLLERDMDAALRAADTMLDTLFFCFNQPNDVAQVAARLLSRVAQKLAQDARISDDLSDALNALTEKPLSQHEITITVRSLLTEWMQMLDTQPAARMQRIRVEIERYIQQHYAEDLSIKRVAKAMHYSEPYFSKLFSRCFHRNFVSYLTDIRMQAAREMLANSMENVRDISLSAGFTDANYFAKVFRKTYGISPTEYRRFAFTQEQGEDQEK